MKAAIYSRVLENEQRQDVQLFFDELERQKIEPVIFQQYYDQLKEEIRLPANVRTFSLAEHLRERYQTHLPGSPRK